MNTLALPITSTFLAEIDQEGMEHVDRAVKMVFDRAGIVAGENRKPHIARQISALSRRKGLQISQLLDALQQNADHTAWPDFINAFTVNHTAFFREAHHFTHLAAQLKARGPLKIWCAAASTGEEPYTLAMVVNETVGEHASHPEIFATDIDTQAIAQAKSGIYDATRLSNLSQERVRRHFLRGTDANSGRAKIKPDVRKRVRFDTLNLNDKAWPQMGPFDVIFCRNTMIYFNRPTQERLVKRFANHLRPNGLLYIGHSETLSATENQVDFKLLGQTIYQKA